jgi:uncharacterized membrane protein
VSWIVWVALGGALVGLVVWLWSRRGSAILKSSVALVRSWSERRRAELDRRLAEAQSEVDQAAKDTAQLDRRLTDLKADLGKRSDLEGLTDEALADRFNKLPKSDS